MKETITADEEESVQMSGARVREARRMLEDARAELWDAARELLCVDDDMRQTVCYLMRMVGTVSDCLLDVAHDIDNEL